MNNSFNDIYLNIIQEEKLKNPKWKFYKKEKNVEIYLNKDHVLKQCSTRYDVEKFFIYQRIILSYVSHLLDLKIFELKIKSELKGFTFHEISNNIWVSGILQNDKSEKQFRLYVSTFLPSDDPYYNKHDFFFEFTF